MSDDNNKKKRSPHVSQTAFLRAMMTLRHNLERSPTLPEITTFLNTHQYDAASKIWSENPEGTPNGFRDHMSVGSRLSQVRGEIEEQLSEKPDQMATVLAILEITGSKREATDFDSIVSEIASLGLLRVPGNMIQKGSEAVGTNGEPVGSQWVEV